MGRMKNQLERANQEIERMKQSNEYIEQTVNEKEREK